MDADNYTFCRRDHPSSSFSSFQDMRKSGELIDFKITVQNRCFVAHRLVIAAGIPFLRTMFGVSADEIPLEGMDPDIFEQLIDYAYTGEIDITVGNVQSMLIASQKLLLTEVHDACLKYLALRVNANNVFGLRSFAGDIQSLRLAAICDHCILRNFDTFVAFHPQEFVQLPFPYLREIISRDDLNVSSEEKVFEAAVKWVQVSPLERRCLFPELLRCVRMIRLAPHYLVERVSTEELVMSCSISRFLVEETKNYHLLSRKPCSSPPSLNTCPRNTTGHGLYAICSSALETFVELYDLDKDVWITLAHIRKKIDHIVGFNGKLYKFQNFCKEIETFDVKTLQNEQLTTLQSLSSPIEYFNQIIVHNSKFYVLINDEVYCFDPKLKKWLGLKTFIECNNSGIASMGEHIYITGGQVSFRSQKASKRYSPSIEKWDVISSMLVARSSHGCAGLNGKIYVCGGIRATSAEVYDPLTDQWNFVSPMKTAKTGISLAAYRGRLYAVGSSAMEIYDPESNEWKEGPVTPSSCEFTKFATIPFAGDMKGCPEFSDLRLKR